MATFEEAKEHMLRGGLAVNEKDPDGDFYFMTKPVLINVRHIFHANHIPKKVRWALASTDTDLYLPQLIYKYTKQSELISHVPEFVDNGNWLLC